MAYKITHPTKKIKAVLALPFSKSISNRVLIIQALCKQSFRINNLSDSDDTKVLKEALALNKTDIYVGHAGTSSRFLTAFLANRSGEFTLRGSDRLHQRPIGILVDCLRSLGAEIEYLEQDGCLPLKINGKQLVGEIVKIDGSISSQFISALLMIAPVLENGLQLKIEGDLVSKPYVQMTLNLMEEFGIEYTWQQNKITIAQQAYKAFDFTVEADWSAVAFLYQMADFAQQCKLVLKGLFSYSIQGDQAIIEIMDELGMKHVYMKPMFHIIKAYTQTNHLKYDFTACPDLAQAVTVFCAAKEIEGTFTGLQTLKHKETDRRKALQIELAKVGVNVEVVGDNGLKINGKMNFTSSPTFDTYNDHRMAMCLAPLALILPEITINDPQVVSKSYPTFWSDMREMGFVIEED